MQILSIEGYFDSWTSKMCQFVAKLPTQNILLPIIASLLIHLRKIFQNYFNSFQTHLKHMENKRLIFPGLIDV